MDEQIVVQHSWFAVIPAEILLHKEISDKGKLLYALVSNLSNEKGYCFALNKYLAEKLNCSKDTITRHLTELEHLGYINRVFILDENGQVKNRTLTPLANLHTPPQKCG